MRRVAEWATRALIVALLITGCARIPEVIVAAPPPPPPPPPPLVRNDLFVVVPGADGKAGSVVILQDGKETVLDSAYAAARAAKDGRLESATLDEREVQQAFAPTLAAAPPRPLYFRLQFVLGTNDFTNESELTLKAVLAEIKRRPAPEVIVIGHTDHLGTEEFNDRLSRERADRVRQELIRIGIPDEAISVAGRGWREPLVPAKEQVPEPANRRVEVTVR